MGKLIKQTPSRKVVLRTPGQFEFTPANSAIVVCVFFDRSPISLWESQLVTYFITTRAFYKKNVVIKHGRIDATATGFQIVY
jgi:hypothetical protein